MKLSELQDGQVVICRTGIAGRNAVEWSRWGEHPLYIRRREFDIPKSNRRGTKGNKKGDIIIITLSDDVWVAEASMDDFCSDSPEGGCFNVEEYYLQIQGLIKG